MNNIIKISTLSLACSIANATQELPKYDVNTQILNIPYVAKNLSDPSFNANLKVINNNPLQIELLDGIKLSDDQEILPLNDFISDRSKLYTPIVVVGDKIFNLRFSLVQNTDKITFQLDPDVLSISPQYSGTFQISGTQTQDFGGFTCTWNLVKSGTIDLSLLTQKYNYTVAENATGMGCTNGDIAKDSARNENFNDLDFSISNKSLGFFNNLEFDADFEKVSFNEGKISGTIIDTFEGGNSIFNLTGTLEMLPVQ